MDQCVHGVKAPLYELCQLVRDGHIPDEVVVGLVEKYRRKPDFTAIKHGILEAARRKIAEIREEKDKRKSMAVCITVVGFSPEEQDVQSAIDIIGEMGNGAKDEALAALVRALVETDRLERAKNVVLMIESAYWKAEALLCIACVSQLAEDFEAVRVSAEEIQDEPLKKNALDDVDYAQERKTRSTSIPSDLDFQQKSQAVSQLVRSLVTLNNLGEVISAALAIESAYWQINVLAIIAEALKDLN